MDERTAGNSLTLSPMEKSTGIFASSPLRLFSTRLNIIACCVVLCKSFPGTDNGGSISVTLCRLCVSSNERTIPIFSEHGKELQLAYKINKLLPIMITPLDMMPQEVCYTCIKELYAACEFVNECLGSQVKLRKILKIKEADDSIPIQVIQDYSAHWSNEDSSEKMGYSREHLMERLNKLCINYEEDSYKEEGRNGPLKQMKLFYNDNDNGSDVSEQSVNCADMDEMDTDLPSYVMDTANDMYVESDSMIEKNAAPAKASNVYISNHISDISVVDEFRTTKSIKYLCKFCGEGFAWKAELFKHQLVQHADLVTSCVYCGKIFYDEDELIPHEKAHKKMLPPGLVIKRQEISIPKKEKNNSYIEPPVVKRITPKISTKYAFRVESKSVDSHDSSESDKTCYYCNLVFPTLKLHRIHVRKRHPLRFPCRFCVATHTSHKQHRIHEAKHKSVTCTCKKVFYFADHLRDHRLIHMHTDKLKCEVCEDTFTCEGSLEEHIRSHDGESSYLCETCGESFESFFMFRVHKLNHMYPGVQRCEICDSCFHGMEELDSHLVVVHRKKKIYCGVCGEEFISLKYLKKHKEKQNCSNVSCKICGKVFFSLRKLRVHAKVHYSEKNYLCDKCGKGYKSKRNLQIHLRHKSCIITFLPCNVCGRNLGNQARLDIHMRVHKEERLFQCDVCGKSFYTSVAMKQHLNTHAVPKIPCTICGILFVRKATMLLHMKRHRVACDTCGEVFENSPLLFEHQKTHLEGGERSVNSEIQPKLYECDVCGKKYITPTGLKHHKPVHSDERPYGCSLCDRRYRRSKDLAKHKNVRHGGSKSRYRCRFCSCTYATQQMLLKHEKEHTVGKPFKCEICGLGFCTTLRLERHLVKHANGSLSRKYVCKHCGKSFLQHSSLISHRSTHTKLLNYTCSFCPRKFSRFGYLKRHKCPFDPSLKISSTSIQNSTFTGDTPTILADGSVLQLAQPEDPGGGGNANADFYRHLRTVTNNITEDITTYENVKSSDEEEYMEPVHPHLRYPHSTKTVQLVSDIPVFVRKYAYKNLVVSKVSSTTLARNLLDQVFTDEALRKCSVKGQRPNTHNIPGRRESLCPQGTAAIIAFVQKRNDSLGRPPIKSADIVMAMGHRLGELRRRPLIRMDAANENDVIENAVTENAVIEIQVF